MTNVLILGANGRVARHTTARFLNTSDARLTLFLRRAQWLANPSPDRCRIVEGDVTNSARLAEAMTGHDVVFASLSGDLPRQARGIIDAMERTGLRRLIFISSMGIYGEVPGQRYQSILDPYRDAAAAIEQSDLDYTILRPGWFTHVPGASYRLTRKGEPFVGHDVTMDSLAELVVMLATEPELYVRQSLGVSSP